MWLIYALLSSVTAALVAIFGKLGLKGIDSTLATTIRAIIMAGFLVITSLLLKKFEGFSLNSLGSKDWVLITLSGVAGALSWLFYFWALKYADAPKVAAIDRTSIVFVVLLAAIFLGDTLGWKSILGAAFMVLGAIMISL